MLAVRFLGLIPALIFLLSLSACGGASSSGEDVGPAEIGAYAASLDDWMTSWSQSSFPSLDRDMAFCYGPDDPVPPPSPPDPSGHTRARIACLEAGRQIRQELSSYKDLHASLKSIRGNWNDPRVLNTQEALQEAHDFRLATYEQISFAAGLGDSNAVAALKGRYDELAKLETEALKAITALAAGLPKDDSKGGVD
jgi:hypothetical protein